MNEEMHRNFLTSTEHTGRHVVYSFRTGKRYYIEPIEKDVVKWGDLNPATGKVEGNYGQKYRGGIDEKDSMITQENGFKNIAMLPPGHSPMAEIERRDAEYPTLVR